MADATERPEDTVRRFAQRLEELNEWQSRYREAAKLWDAMELQPHDQVTECVIIGKIMDFDNGGTAVSLGCSDGCDWITQLGILHAALMVLDANPPVLKNE